MSSTTHGNPPNIVIPDIMGAIYDYVATFSDIAAEHIFIASSNRITLPKHSNKFALISLISSSDYGTNSKKVTLRDDTGSDYVTTASLKKIVVQIDIYGNSMHTSFVSMESLRMLWHDPIACSFFENQEIAPLYVGDTRRFCEVDASDQFTERFSADFTLCAWQCIHTDIQTFSSVDLQQFANIDTLKIQ